MSDLLIGYFGIPTAGRRSELGHGENRSGQLLPANGTMGWTASFLAAYG